MKKSGGRRGVLVYKGPDPAGKMEIPVKIIPEPHAGEGIALPFAGDVIELRRDQELVIKGYDPSGEERIAEAPATLGKLEKEDSTGNFLPSGIRVKVLECITGPEHSTVRQVWVHVTKYTETK